MTMQKIKTGRLYAVLFVLIVIKAQTSFVFGDLDFSSDFTGGANWNWTSVVGDVSGTDELVASYGDPVSAAYAFQDIADPTEESPDICRLSTLWISLI